MPPARPERTADAPVAPTRADAADAPIGPPARPAVAGQKRPRDDETAAPVEEDT